MIREHLSGARRASILLGLPLCLTAALTVAPGQAVTGTSASSTELSRLRIIRTTPFVGSTTSMRDNEGSAYVKLDHALWLVDDNARRINIINPSTGALKRTIGPRVLAEARRYRGTQKAGESRSRDMESVAYDTARDRLYVFAGNDCKPSRDNCQLRSRPTVFRFDRISGKLRLHSFQPLASGFDNTAAAWNPNDRRLYVGHRRNIRAYSYTANSHGTAIQVEGLREIYGMDFNARGTALFVAHEGTLLSRARWADKSLSWTQDLTSFGVRDARGVEQIGGRLFVSDGYDDRRLRSRLRYAVFVFE
jgi:hypothetical protein